MLVCALPVAGLLGLAVWDGIQSVQPKPAVPVRKVDTTGVPLPDPTPYEGNAELKAAFIEGFCDAYRLGSCCITRCGFGPEVLTPRWQAADAGWNAGQSEVSKRQRAKRAR
jgi:hypothetical protein